jgi:hypothetical protein
MALEDSTPDCICCILNHSPEKSFLHNPTEPSSDVVARTVPVAFHTTRHICEFVSIVTQEFELYSNTPFSLRNNVCIYIKI